MLDALTGGVGKPLAANLEPSGIAKADSSIWEVHVENDKHFAYTTLATIRGFCDPAALLKRAVADGQQDLSRSVDRARAGFFFLDRDGAIAGSTEELGMNQYLDGAVVEAFTWNVLKDSEYSERTGKATLDLIDRLRVPSGWLQAQRRWQVVLRQQRVDPHRSASRRCPVASRARSRRAQQPAASDRKAAANFYLLPELYNAVAADGMVGKYTGSIPMVGYGGGAYVLPMLDRSGLIEANDCGDGMGNKSPRAARSPATPTIRGDQGHQGTLVRHPPTAEELPVRRCLPAVCLPVMPTVAAEPGRWGGQRWPWAASDLACSPSPPEGQRARRATDERRSALMASANRAMRSRLRLAHSSVANSRCSASLLWLLGGLSTAQAQDESSPKVPRWQHRLRRLRWHLPRLPSRAEQPTRRFRDARVHPAAPQTSAPADPSSPSQGWGSPSAGRFPRHRLLPRPAAPELPQPRRKCPRRRVLDEHSHPMAGR